MRTTGQVGDLHVGGGRGDGAAFDVGELAEGTGEVDLAVLKGDHFGRAREIHRARAVDDDPTDRRGTRDVHIEEDIRAAHGRAGDAEGPAAGGVQAVAEHIDVEDVIGEEVGRVDRTAGDVGGQGADQVQDVVAAAARAITPGQVGREGVVVGEGIEDGRSEGQGIVIDGQVATGDRGRAGAVELVEGDRRVAAQRRVQGEVAVVPDRPGDRRGGCAEGRRAALVDRQVRIGLVVHAVQRAGRVDENLGDVLQAVIGRDQGAAVDVDIAREGVGREQSEGAGVELLQGP